MAIRIRRENMSIATAAAFVIGMFVVTTRLGKPKRNAAPARGPFVMPRPLVRTRPRLRVVDGGVQESTALVPTKADPFQEILERLFHSEPQGGAFYIVREGDSPETIAREVLRRVGRYRKANIIDYIHLMSSSRWNLDRYGSPSTTNSFPSEWLVPGFGKGLRAAFLPRNADAIEAIANGRIPKRTIDPRTGIGTGEGESLGVIWLPPVSPEGLREGMVTCSHQTWSDGSSSIEPPPEFLAFMEAAA